MTSTFTIVLAIRRSKLSSGFEFIVHASDSCSKTVITDRRQLPVVRPLERLVDQPATVDLLFKRPPHRTRNIVRLWFKPDKVQEPSFVINESCTSIQTSPYYNTHDGYLGSLCFGTDTTHGRALAVNLRSVYEHFSIVDIIRTVNCTHNCTISGRVVIPTPFILKLRDHIVIVQFYDHDTFQSVLDSK